MTAARLTAAEAKALGLTAKAARAPKRTGRAVPAKDCLPTRCRTCGEVFTGETAEARHNADTGHPVFETVLP